jgi:uroporphyrinogen decarboxylase
LFLDGEVQAAVVERFGLAEELDADDPDFARWLQIKLQRFLGYDYVRCTVGYAGFPRETVSADDTAPEGMRHDKRNWADEHRGPISSWEDFENYPWPDPHENDTSELEWYSKHLPEDMCLVATCNQVFEQVTWLMGYEPLCYALYDRPDLVDALFERSGSIQHEIVKVIAQFDRVACIWGSDDMGFRNGTMIPAQILIDRSLCWHGKGARVAHDAGKLYLLHACGKLEELMPAIVHDCKIDARHSFEDTAEPVVEVAQRWGDEISLLGGIPVDFLCRADEAAIRQYVRKTLDACLPGGGYCLGTGNSVANYIPVDSYLTMLDEGRRYTA